MSFTVKRLSAGLGAEVLGLDLSRPLDADTVKALRAAWLEHLVLLFRGQRLGDEAFVAFSRHFGELHSHENYQGELVHPTIKELLVVRSTLVPGKVVRFGQQMHSDLSFTTRPAMGSVLHCRQLPDIGGDTIWSNMYMAYERLSEPIKRMIEPLYAVHDVTHGDSHFGDPEEIRAADARRNPPVRQPVVRVHPETGRKALFVSEWMCTRIEGLSRMESDAILQMLFKHSVRPEFVFRQQWRVDDILIWDNRCTIHQALRDYDESQQRELIRTSLVGTPCGELVWPKENRAAA
ncbi:TauD/TfdA dioxygenase family protein [Achromobacter aloeverae]